LEEILMERRPLRDLLAGFAVILVTVSCSDATEPEGDPPELPPLTSFVMDFGDFTDSPLAAPDVSLAATAAGTYWLRSALVVGVWNTILTVTLAPPVAAFVASFNHEPVWSADDGAWTWPYDFTVLGVQHSARLEARLVAAGVQWDMYITRDGSFNDFHWYTGTSNITGTSGTWILNMSPNDPTEFLDIAWSRSASGDTYELTYTNAVAGTAEYGSYITYGVTGDTPYNAFYDLYGAQGGNLTEIEWNRTTKGGRTRDPAHFGDSDWRCWDANLDNTTCQ
jgi:hypothetical protein